MTTNISSMTGFARVDGALNSDRWVWEVKSVNGRGLEMRFRLPPGWERLEQALRKIIAERMTRGSVFASLQLTSLSDETRLHVNSAALDYALAQIEKLRVRTECGPSRPEAILALRGVLEPKEDTSDDKARLALENALKTGFEKAVVALNDARRSEGEAMAAVVAAHIDDIETLADQAAASEAASLQAIQDRLRVQLDELLQQNSVAEDRLAQETAMMAVKADVREELNRLAAHVDAARALLARGGPIGRELDFLTQEFNRETNTLCAKAPDIALKRIGLDLKKVIDQLREQIQNIE